MKLCALSTNTHPVCGRWLQMFWSRSPRTSVVWMLDPQHCVSYVVVSCILQLQIQTKSVLSVQQLVEIREKASIIYIHAYIYIYIYTQTHSHTHPHTYTYIHILFIVKVGLYFKSGIWLMDMILPQKWNQMNESESKQFHLKDWCCRNWGIQSRKRMIWVLANL